MVLTTLICSILLPSTYYKRKPETMLKIRERREETKYLKNLDNLLGERIIRRQDTIMFGIFILLREGSKVKIRGEVNRWQTEMINDEAFHYILEV